MTKLMTKTRSAQESYSIVEEAARAADDGVRMIPDTMQIGQVARQGDIYLHRVSADHPCGAATTDRQLAVGTTQGSRHVADAPAQVYIGTTPPPTAPRTLLGPCIVLSERGVVSHPEHAHISLPAGVYQVTHQMDARTLERVSD